MADTRETGVVVLHTQDFPSLDDLFTARAAISAPVLFRVRRQELDAVLDRVRDGDDVSLEDDPPALVDHRLRTLVRTRGDGRRDPLTGVLDRSTFGRRFAEVRPSTLLLVNIDHFKRLNDQHGHEVGDAVLQEVAARLEAVAPPDALVARTGGDLFAVALPSSRDARAVATAIRAATHADPFAHGVRVTVSIGVASAGPASPLSLDEISRRADAALYAAKARGRDRIVDYADREREARARDADPDLEGFEEMTRVLAERVADVIAWRGRRVFQGLRDQADLDALTGLFSRRYLDRRLPFEIEQARAANAPISIGLLDIDHFGRVNKEHGWPSGDRVLAETAARVRRALRGSDWAARYGGEEMCIVLEGAAIADAKQVLERVRAEIAAAPFDTTSGQKLAVSVSIGAAEIAGSESAADLVERASTQLLAAKAAGRNLVR